MRWAIVLLILLGVLAATSAALLVASYGRTQRREPVNVEILVATKALPAQAVLDANMVKLKVVAKKEAPAQTYTNAVQVVGKMLIIPIAEGQAITPDCFGDRETGAKFAAAIPEGMVAMSITPKDFSSLEGLLYPGCLVDVIYSHRPNDNQQPVSLTLLQAVNVLAIGQHSIVSPKHEVDTLAATPSHEAQKVTLQLTPRQAKILQLAMENGSVSLALRNPLSPAPADGESISLDEVLRKKKLAPRQTTVTTQSAEEPEELPPVWDVLLIQGGQREMRTVPMPEPK
jgi:pilus assembly protein CpaB